MPAVRDGVNVTERDPECDQSNDVQWWLISGPTIPSIRGYPVWPRHSNGFLLIHPGALTSAGFGARR